MIRELIGETSRVVPDNGWQVQYVFFARSGFTDAARRETELVGATLVDLSRLDRDLSPTV